MISDKDLRYIDLVSCESAISDLNRTLKSYDIKYDSFIIYLVVILILHVSYCCLIALPVQLSKSRIPDPNLRLMHKFPTILTDIFMCEIKQSITIHNIR